MDIIFDESIKSRFRHRWSPLESLVDHDSLIEVYVKAVLDFFPEFDRSLGGRVTDDDYLGASFEYLSRDSIAKNDIHL